MEIPAPLQTHYTTNTTKCQVIFLLPDIFFVRYPYFIRMIVQQAYFSNITPMSKARGFLAALTILVLNPWETPEG